LAGFDLSFSKTAMDSSLGKSTGLAMVAKQERSCVAQGRDSIGKGSAVVVDRRHRSWNGRRRQTGVDGDQGTGSSNERGEIIPDAGFVFLDSWE